MLNQIYVTHIKNTRAKQGSFAFFYLTQSSSILTCCCHQNCYNNRNTILVQLHLLVQALVMWSFWHTKHKKECYNY